jgi:hypothetical protein
MILLDFYSGSHGHFLEYVINTYIFKGPRVEQVFTDLGTSHGTKKHSSYKASKIIHCGHYTEFDLKPAADPSQLVRICIDSDFEKTVYQINVMHRAGDIPVEKKIENIDRYTRNDAAKLRNNYLSKLNDTGYHVPNIWRWDNTPYYEFPMGCFYDLCDFYSELYRLARFLNHTFNPDQSLTELWQEFMQKNQGWQCWNQAQTLLAKTLSNTDHEFLSDVWTQAVLNFLLTKCVGIYDGELFENPAYPTNTQLIYSIVQQHLQDFDKHY